MKTILFVLLAVILVSVLILSGCSQAASSPAANPSPAKTVSPAATILPTPTIAPTPNKNGGVLKINFQGSPDVFGVPLNLKAVNGEYSKFSLETLIRVDDKKPGALVPILATSWEMAPDKSSYTFHLRKGVMFHDGTPFNAQAVKWNLDKVIAAPVAYLKKVKSIDVVDENTVRFNLSSWDALFILDLADQTCSIMSPTAYQKEGEDYLNKHPIGTGPFMFKSYERTVSIVFVKNPNYWDKSLPYLDEIQFTHALDPVTQMGMLKKGDTYAMLGVNVTTAGQMVGQGFNVDYIPQQHNVISFDAQSSSSIWSDKRMREALEYAIDKKSICKTVGLGIAEPVYEVLYGINSYGKPGTTPRVFDQAKAKKLIDEAGNSKGVTVTLYVSQLFMSDLIQAMMANLAQVGINVNLQIMTHTAFIEKSRTPPGPNELIWNPLKSQLSETNILGFATIILAPTGSTVPNMLRPQNYNDLIAQALNEADAAKQLALLDQAEQILYGEEVVVPMWTNPYCDITSPKVHYQWFWAKTPNFYFQDAWIEK